MAIFLKPDDRDACKSRLIVNMFGGITTEVTAGIQLPLATKPKLVKSFYHCAFVFKTY